MGIPGALQNEIRHHIAALTIFTLLDNEHNIFQQNSQKTLACVVNLLKRIHFLRNQLTVRSPIFQRMTTGHPTFR